MTSEQRLIGLLGEAGSGKDTAGKIMVQEHGFYSLALADPIKIYCNWMFGWNPKRLFDSSELRNEGDKNYPFLRCPSCGFTSYNMTTIDYTENTVVCGLCGAVGAPREWPADLSARFALQSLGDWARNLNESAYIEFALHRAVKVQNCGVDCDPLFHLLKDLNIAQERFIGHPRSVASNVLITDVRLLNEVRGIQNEGGKVFRIRRNTKPDNTTTGIPRHNSEVAQREISDETLNGIIENNTTLDALRERVTQLITES